jgi:hypothetical protein
MISELSWQRAMQNDLRKLAQALREKAAEYEQRKFVKCAQIVQGTIGLARLQRKIGRK